MNHGVSVILIHPNLTIGKDTVADLFYNVLRDELEEYTEVRNLKTAMHLHSVTILSGEVIVIFNNQDQDYSENVILLLKHALEIDCTIIPVSLDKNTRTPAELISHIQSFEVVDQLRQRRLTDKNIETVAFALTRLIMSEVQPTMSVDRMDIFISHRRADGEELAAEFYNEFRRRANDVEIFRDLITIKVGESAQEEIEKNLQKSDAVIFIDTPLCGESEWVDKELQIALGLNLPIVWVKVGAKDNRAKLNVMPGGSPHYYFEEIDEEYIQSSGLVDDIIHKAFHISRLNAMTVIDHFNRLQQLAYSNKLELIPINKKNMIYRVVIPRNLNGLNYYERPLSHVFQLFGRNPKSIDRESFEPLISNFGFLLHPDLGYHFDSGLLLGPNASLSEVSFREPICVDSVDGYVTSLQRYLSSDQIKPPKKGVIISGAFPDYEPEFQQQLIDAIFAFSKAVLDKGGTVIFGSHPTFQHMILDLARRIRPEDYISAVHMYISRYFVTQATINELTNKATIYSTDNVNDNRAESLSTMRKAMISDEEVAGIILLGGKQYIDIKPGIDEELELATQKGIPAFIIGSVGGRSSELAKEFISHGSEPINNLTKEQNNRLLTSLDYRSLADEILQTLGF